MVTAEPFHKWIVHEHVETQDYRGDVARFVFDAVYIYKKFKNFDQSHRRALALMKIWDADEAILEKFERVWPEYEQYKKTGHMEHPAGHRVLGLRAKRRAELNIPPDRIVGYW